MTFCPSLHLHLIVTKIRRRGDFMLYYILLLQVLLDTSLTAAVWLYGSIGIICAIVAVCLPIETKGRELPVSIYRILHELSSNLNLYETIYQASLSWVSKSSYYHWTKDSFFLAHMDPLWTSLPRVSHSLVADWVILD